MAKKSSILLETDRRDPEDFPVDRAALDRAHMGRRIRRLRNRLGLTQEGFAERYGIPLSAIRQYEIARPCRPRGTGLSDRHWARAGDGGAGAPSRRRLRADAAMPVSASHHTLSAWSGRGDSMDPPLG